MELKTNPKDEVKRSDGLHFGWDSKKSQAILYIGESKLHESLSPAISDAIASIEKLYDEDAREDEIRLLTTHFKYIAPEFQKAVLQWLDSQLSSSQFRMTHVCLIGYDWNHYKKVGTGDRKEFVAKFVENFQSDITRLGDLIKDKLKASKISHLEFEFILLPFRSVQEFRDLFLKHLTGISDETLDLKKELVRLKSENTKLKQSVSPKKIAMPCK